MSGARLDPEDAWDLADVIGATYVEIAAIAGAGAESDGLTLAELVALAVLAQHPEGLSQSVWGRLQGVSRQRAHVVARSMIRRGLVTTQKEGRESNVRFTDDGRALTATLRHRVGQQLADAMSEVPPNEARDAGERLQPLLASMRAHDPSRLDRSAKAAGPARDR